MEAVHLCCMNMAGDENIGDGFHEEIVPVLGGQWGLAAVDGCQMPPGHHLLHGPDGVLVGETGNRRYDVVHSAPVVCQYVDSMEGQGARVPGEDHPAGVKELLYVPGQGGLGFSFAYSVVIPRLYDDLDMVRQGIEVVGDGMVLEEDVRDIKILLMAGVHPDTVHHIPGEHKIFDPRCHLPGLMVLPAEKGHGALPFGAEKGLAAHVEIRDEGHGNLLKGRGRGVPVRNGGAYDLLGNDGGAMSLLGHTNGADDPDHLVIQDGAHLLQEFLIPVFGDENVQ